MRKLLFVVALFVLAPAAFGQIARFTGDWKNANPASRGIVRVIVRAAGSGATVQVFGSCSPTPCDWGVQPAVVYAPSVTASPVATARAMTAAYRFNFKDVIVVLRPDGTAGLSGEFYSRFTPADGRTNYVLFERFVRQ